MTKELRDVLSQAEASTASGLPGFDYVVLARGVIRKAKRRRAVRNVGTGMVAVAALGVLGIGGSIVYGQFNNSEPGIPVPSESFGPTPSPTEAPEWPDVAAREVTTGAGLPSAVALTGEALDSSETGWVLAIFDSTFRSNTEAPIDGERVLYLISPAGERFEVANLTEYGAPYLAAWDTERDVAFIVENRYVALTVDLASGEVTGEWQFCGEGGSMNATDLPGDQWLLRGFCSGESLDGIYSDDGTFVTDEGVVKGGEGVTVMAVGDTQVTFEFEAAPDEAFRAYHADGTEIAVRPVSDDLGCYPLGPSLTGGLAVQCWGEGDEVSLWSLDLDGGAATPIATTATLSAIESASGGSLPASGAFLAGYQAVGEFDALLTSHPAVVVLGADSPIVLTNGEYRGTSVYGGVGHTVLVAGVGPLWTWDAANSGAIVTLLPVPEPGDDGVWVGASEAGAIIHP